MPKILEETPFKGLNLGVEPERLEPGELAVADNAVIDGGDLYTRPGYQGQLSALLSGGAIYGFTPFISGGASWAVFACGGKLYKWQFGATSATELLEGGLSLSLTTAGVQTAAAPSFVYIVDGVGSLHRVDLTSSVAMTSLTTPTAPAATLWGENIVDCSDANYSPTAAPRWFGYQLVAGFSPAYTLINNATLDGSFETWGAGGATTWSTTGEPLAADTTNAIASVTPSAGTYCARFDRPGEAVYQTLNAPTNYESGYRDSLTVASGSTTTTVPLSAAASATDDFYNGDTIHFTSGALTGVTATVLDYNGATKTATVAALASAPVAGVGVDVYRSFALRRIRTYRLRLKVHSDDTGGLSTIRVRLTSSQGSVQEFTCEQASQAGATDWIRHEFNVQFADDPTTITIRLWADEGNTAAMYVDEVELLANPLHMAVSLTTSALPGGVAAAQNSLWFYVSADTDTEQPMGHQLQGNWIARDLGANTDLSKMERIGARIVWQQPITSLPPRLRFGFRAAGGTQVYWSGPTTQSDDGLSVWADVSGIDRTTMAACRYIFLQFEDNAPEGSIGSVGYIGQIGPIFQVGNLAAGADYWYRIMEIDGSGDATLLDVPESDVSPASTVVTTTSAKSMGRLTIPARANSSATYFAVYRYGGTLIDPERGKFPLGLLVGILSWSQATFDFGAGPAAGSGTVPRAPANPYLKWTLTSANNGGVLVDNTPDGWLGNGQVAMEGREPASSISAPKDVALWDGRVWLTSGSAELYASWRTSTDRRAGLYFAKVYQPGPQDVHAAIRGWWVKLALDTGDAIQAIVPIQDGGLGSLAVLTTQGVWMVTPAQIGYTVQRIDGAPGVVGARAALFAHGALWWLAPDGLWSMTGGSARRVSDAIQSALPPLSDLTPSALALSSIVAWWRYLLLIIPGATGDTYPTVAYVWDHEEQAWTKFLGSAWTGGSALQSGGSLGRLIVTSRDGQIFAIGTAGGDKALSGSAAAGVAMSVRTRSVRSRSIQTPEEVGFDVKAGAAGSMTLTTK
ncbi:MAG TPA: hypothetical protein PK308_07375, partial [Phycisphaerales bacterium]|nr:hypothetical protein [Phycisphaerales bacterium]